jgi:predicted GTPase
MAVEIKSKPTEKDIAHHIGRLEIVRDWREKRQEKPKRILGAIAGAVFPESLKEAVIEAGLYVIEQSGDTMKISVPEGFKPREW